MLAKLQHRLNDRLQRVSLAAVVCSICVSFSLGLLFLAPFCSPFICRWSASGGGRQSERRRERGSRESHARRLTTNFFQITSPYQKERAAQEEERRARNRSGNSLQLLFLLSSSAPAPAAAAEGHCVAPVHVCVCFLPPLTHSLPHSHTDSHPFGSLFSQSLDATYDHYGHDDGDYDARLRIPFRCSRCADCQCNFVPLGPSISLSPCVLSPEQQQQQQ